MYDAIVIGSGIGGLGAAGILARAAGKRVLVVEKHTEPGGLTHVFRRDGASWDVGLHYVGDLEEGGQIRAYFDFLSGGKLQWNRMPDPFERFIYPGFEFAVPADAQRYQEHLTEAFPEEAAAIRRYFRDVDRAVRWMTLHFARRMVPAPVAPLLRAAQLPLERLATQTTKSYLDSHIGSPALRCLLATQWGDYGLPPSRSAFGVHAQIVRHYLGGAWFPDGGSGRIARGIEQGIEAAGGAVRVAAEATRIIVENGRAVGVEVRDARRGDTRIHRAPVVISGIDATTTYERLLPIDGAVGRATARVRAAIGALGKSTNAVTLYLRLRDDVRTIGVQGENYWINTTWDHESQPDTGLLEGRPERIYLSFPSVKAGHDRHHTAEIIAFCDGSLFDEWKDSPQGNRGAAYTVLKDRVADGLLRLADEAMPGLAALVSYRELSTPLSVEHFTSHPGGAFYGLPATPERFRIKELGLASPIPGLYLAGQDGGCLGIVGALMTGVGAACQALGPRGFPMIQAALKKTPAATADVLPEGKHRARLVNKRHVAPQTWLVEFALDGQPPQWAPGQFARIAVASLEWRDYSIAGVDGSRVRFLISTATGGLGSRFIERADVGAETVIELPLGRFRLSPGQRRVFVATGTGLAPFLPMFEALEASGDLGQATLLFGCRVSAENLLSSIDTPLPSRVEVCLSRETAENGTPPRRVTDALAEFDTGADYYVCGHPAMVADVTRALARRGVQGVFTETY